MGAEGKVDFLVLPKKPQPTPIIPLGPRLYNGMSFSGGNQAPSGPAPVGPWGPGFSAVI